MPRRARPSDKLDSRLAKFVVLFESMPQALAMFARQGKKHETLIKRLLADPQLMKQMLVADSAKAPRVSRGFSFIPAQFGPAMKIYTVI